MLHKFAEENIEMSQQPTHSQAIEKINELIKGKTIAMLTSVSDEGHFHARPMAILEMDFDGNVWFFTKKDTAKVEQIGKEPRVNVAYSDPSSQNYVSLAGNASLVVDKALNEKYWKPQFEAWFPDGLDDPELALLKVEVGGAEYWDAPSSTVAHIKGFIQSKISGEQEHVGDHAKVAI